MGTRELILGVFLTVASLSLGCARSDTDVCPSGLRCPLGKVCAARQNVCIDILGCGDMHIGEGENCDDGNIISGDGCSANCIREECRNQVVDPHEICDEAPPEGFYCTDLGYDFGHLACTACTADDSQCGGFDWLRTPAPSAENLRAVWVGGPDRAFAAGDEQTLLVYDDTPDGPGDSTGATWTEKQLRVQLSAFSGRSIEHVVAVGEQGAIVRYDGQAWVGVPQAATDADLHAVYTDGPGYALAAGEGGTIIRYDGAQWTQLDHQLTDAPLYGIWANKTGDLFAVGAAGTILHRRGVDWLLHSLDLPQPTSVDLYAVSGRAADDVYVAGEAGTLAHFDGQSFTVLTPATPETLRALWVANPGQNPVPDPGQNPVDQLFAVGEHGVIVEYVDGRLSLMNSTTEQTLRAIFGTVGETSAERAMFAVGDGGTILQHLGDTWAEAPIAGPPTPESRPIRDFFGRTPEDVYAVGANGLFWRYDGALWSPVNAPEANDRWWNSVFGTALGESETAVYAASHDGALLRCNEAWQCSLESVTSGPLRAIWGRPVAGVYQWFVVGDDGFAARCDDSACAPILEGAELFGDLHAVHGDAAAVYAVGERGLFHLDPPALLWSDEVTERAILDIQRRDDGSFLIAGERGLLGQFDGTSVTLIPTPSSENLTTIAGTSEDDMYVAGPDMTLLQCDGLECAPIRVPDPDIGFEALFTSSPRDVFIGGRTGGISRLRLPGPSGDTE